jgi:D-alanyl-D-alanine carboxypeptidase (penicillin-binding protein 5/6)
MVRRLWILLVLAASAGALSIPPAPPARAQPGPPSMPRTRAWILADADSGRVLAAQDHHEALPPASTTKLMTALVATERLPKEAVFMVGDRPAAQSAMRIGMRPGQGWALAPVLHALLMVSANDAAYALAEAVSGSLAAFAADMNAAAERYGMRDSVFNDPAGFDDSASFNGGSRVSAYDLAIAARNALAVPELAAIAALPEYRFQGPSGRQHHLRNHNKMLKRYPGAVGLKTGYTRRAGHTFVGAATRDGRTMIAVVLDSDDIYGAAAVLLDRGFATPRHDAGTGERLPAVKVQPFRPPLASTLVKSSEAAEPEATEEAAGGWLRPMTFLLASGAGGTVALRRRKLRRRRDRAERRRQLAEARRRELARVVDPEGWDARCHVEFIRHYERL